MTDVREVSCRPPGKRVLLFLAALSAAGAGAALVRAAYRGPAGWLGGGLLLGLLGLAALHKATARVRADTYGVHSWTLLRRRSVRWGDLADLRVRLKYANTPRVQDTRGISLLLRDGRKLLLPLPRSWSYDDPDFDAKLDAFRALHRLHGTPESDHVPVVSYRTAGRGWAGSLALCLLLLGGAGLAAWFVPSAASGERAWRSATPCTAGTPAADRDECLTTLTAVIARTDATWSRSKSSWLYFVDGRPMDRLAVSSDGAKMFEPGDSVELTVWRGEVREVVGERHVYRLHVPASGELAVVAAVCLLAAGHPAARVLLRLRGRRLPDDEVLPSALPFAGALVGTALWLLPLAYLHPTTLLTDPAAITWAATGSTATLALFVWAWRATRVRTPGEIDATTGVTGETRGTGEAGGFAERETDDEEMDETETDAEYDVFLAARFLEHTDYNPYGFGTHVVLGGGPLAVTPHPGPGRFAAKPVPVERLVVKGVRRVRGSDGDTVPSGWHMAELDDAGTPVRLAAAPDDLTRILRELASGPLRRESRASRSRRGGTRR
ncbi:PH domain-containing protein [Streptomyces phaeochromogenes]|uniref:PH domain-containing protein n=1 Tax=Streptomyces phaeochromogenes TaxID=1923 RepID=UPI00386448E6|nr:PH domain-containing protein [Streptomyces phaeochromogenes]